MCVAGTGLHFPMTEELADHRQAFAEGEIPRGKCMVQIVNAHVLQPGLLAALSHVALRLRRDAHPRARRDFSQRDLSFPSPPQRTTNGRSPSGTSAAASASSSRAVRRRLPTRPRPPAARLADDGGQTPWRCSTTPGIRPPETPSSPSSFRSGSPCRSRSRIADRQLWLLRSFSL